MTLLRVDAPPPVRQQGALLLVVLLAAALLFYGLGERPLWWDEIVNVLIDRQDVREIFVSLYALPGKPTMLDVHPPLFHLLQHAWIKAVGASDLAVRFPSAAYALLALALLYRVGARLGGRTLGTLACLIASLSPFWLLYARMGRYYALTAMLGLAETFLFLELLRRPTRARWITYRIVSLALLYTDYMVAALFVCQAAYLAWARPGRRWLVRWGGSLALVGLIYSPWLPVWYAQSVKMNLLVEADLARSVPGLALKFAFPALSLAIGETIFPWEAPALAGIGLVVTLVIGGLRFLAVRPAPLAWPGRRMPFVLLFILLPIGCTIAVTTLVAPTIPFVGIANRTFFVFPFVALLLAAGLVAIPRAAWRIGALGLLVLVYAYGVRNYFAGEHFINPIYAVPIDQVVDDVLARAQSGDAIFSNADMGFGYYFAPRAPAEVAHFYWERDDGVAALAALEEAIAQGQPLPYRRLFLLTFGRDRSRRELPAAFTEGIRPRARLVWEQGYTPQDATYRQVKQRLLGREDYRYKLLVQLYEVGL